MKKPLLLILAFIIALAPNLALACACGCSLFDVGTSALIPTKPGGLVFAQYDYVSQDKNWHKTSRASDEDNHDREITTQTITLGGQYMFNRDWGLMARVPYVKRDVTVQHEHHGDVETHFTSHNTLGDIKLTGIYSGISDDMSTGLIFGAKLPTGATKQEGFDSHVQIGTGSYDLILGFYHLGKIAASDAVGWFAQGVWQKPLLTRKNYHNGDEISMSVGSYYDFGQIGKMTKVAPMLQLIQTKRAKDGGFAADTDNSGYNRIFIAPGLEINIKQFKLYADIELPIYENVNGHQLAISKMFKIILGYKF